MRIGITTSVYNNDYESIRDHGYQCIDFDLCNTSGELYHLPEEEKAKLQGLPTNLDDALTALEQDNDYLTAGNVFPKELIDNFIKTKRAECRELAAIPHPAEYDKYFNL